MKLHDCGIIILATIFVACVIGAGVSYYFLGADNPVEEIAEEVLKKETGIDVDLTPHSPETKPIAFFV